MVRWLLGVKNNQSKSGNSTLRMLTAILNSDGDLTEQGKMGWVCPKALALQQDQIKKTKLIFFLCARLGWAAKTRSKGLLFKKNNQLQLICPVPMCSHQTPMRTSFHTSDQLAPNTHPSIHDESHFFCCCFVFFALCRNYTCLLGFVFLLQKCIFSSSSFT